MQSSAGLSIDLRRQFAAERLAPLVAALVLTLGVASVSADCLNLTQPAVFNLHLLFGFCLWLAVGGSLLRQRRNSEFGSAAGYYEYSRRLSRWVYILLYLLAGVRLAFHLSELMNYSAAHGNGASIAPRSLDDFQIYIGYALVPLWVMRILVCYVPARD